MPATRNFLRIENIWFLSNVIAFSNLENTYDYTTHVDLTFIAIPQKST